jgi:hypothetical protein
MAGVEGPVTVQEARGLLGFLRKLMNAPELTAEMGCAIAGGVTVVAMAFTAVLIFIAVNTLGADKPVQTNPEPPPSQTQPTDQPAVTDPPEYTNPEPDVPPSTLSASWDLAIEVNGEWQGGVQLRLEGDSASGDATLLLEPAGMGSYTLDEDGILTATLQREYPVDTSVGTKWVTESIVISAAILGDIHLEGNMTRDDWKVYSDGTVERRGTLTYPLQGNLLQ